jgi:hypothetical protein
VGGAGECGVGGGREREVGSSGRSAKTASEQEATLGRWESVKDAK